MPTPSDDAAAPVDAEPPAEKKPRKARGERKGMPRVTEPEALKEAATAQRISFTAPHDLIRTLRIFRVKLVQACLLFGKM